MRGWLYVEGVGVEERMGARGGGGAEMGLEGEVESCPEVVKGVRSRISGNWMWQLFFVA